MTLTKMMTHGSQKKTEVQILCVCTVLSEIKFKAIMTDGPFISETCLKWGYIFSVLHR